MEKETQTKNLNGIDNEEHELPGTQNREQNPIARISVSIFDFEIMTIVIEVMSLDASPSNWLWHDIMNKCVN